MRAATVLPGALVEVSALRLVGQQLVAFPAVAAVPADDIPAHVVAAAVPDRALVDVDAHA